MALNITVPELSESVSEATVAEWFKNVGDPVKAGDILVTLETDKVAVEVTAEADGVLAFIAQPAGSDVKARQVLGTLEATSANNAKTTEIPKDEKPTETPSEKANAQPSAPTVTQQVIGMQQENLVTKPIHVAETTETRATPVAQRMAAANKIDMTQVQSSGGKVTKQDVQNYMDAQQAPSQRTTQNIAATSTQQTPAMTTTSQVSVVPSSMTTAAGRREERVRMSRRRQTIARRLLDAQANAAMLTTFNEIDMSAVMDVRSRRKEAFAKKHGVGLGFSSFFVKAAIGALKAFPAVNGEIQDRDIVYKHYYDIGIAIGAEEGLVVPVLRDADKMSFAQIEQAIKDYAQQSKDGTLSIEALMGGTFTITNGGVFGSMMSTPILNPPQSGILGLHAIKDRPVVVDGQIVIRPMMYVALTYDHRIIDGREAVQFLVKLKELIEDPEQLLLEG
jgi:2-oxoglutarate dehydrogenase E2 component (dihydrolipoamide succinyltransferase)